MLCVNMLSIIALFLTYIKLFMSVSLDMNTSVLNIILDKAISYIDVFASYLFDSIDIDGTKIQHKSNIK